MDLFKESIFVNVNAVPKTQLQKFDYQNIAFVMGTHHLKFPSLCVTIHGELYFSRYTPLRLCQQLEDEWQLYYFYTRQQTSDIWNQLVKQALQEGQTKLGQFRAPMRVATCGGYSFWSPNASNELGLWFFTPTCQDIKVRDGREVDFITTDETGQVTHWTGKRQFGESPLVSQARVEILSDYVLRKAVLTHKVALALAGNILAQQGMQLKDYPPIDVQPMFPLDEWFYDQDLKATLDVLYGHSPELAAQCIEKQYENME